MNPIQMMDAQVAVGFVRSQAAHIEQAVNETVYPDIQYLELIPVDTSAHPFTDTVLFYSSDKFGRAQWINGNADDIPLAGTDRSMFKSAVYTAAIGYGYGWEEINRAQLYGVNLPAEDANAARRAYEEMVDNVALRGSTEKNMSGLINYPGITTNSASAVWSNSSTDATILGDINGLIMGVHQDTNYTSFANTILMSPEKLMFLASRQLGETTMTLLEWIRKNNVYTLTTNQPLDIRGVVGLSTAGAGSTQRMIAYRRDPQVLKMHIPMPHRFLPAQQDGILSVVVPGVFRLGGLDVRRPKEMRRLDGI